jgi:hypothetical protein
MNSAISPRLVESEPIPLRKAKTCDLVFEGGKPFLVLSYDDGPWEKLEINNDQLWHLFNRMAPKLRGR